MSDILANSSELVDEQHHESVDELVQTFLTAGAIGAFLGLLIAPYEGTKTRKLITDHLGRLQHTLSELFPEPTPLSLPKKHTPPPPPTPPRKSSTSDRASSTKQSSVTRTSPPKKKSPPAKKSSRSSSATQTRTPRKRRVKKLTKGKSFHKKVSSK